VDSLFNDIPALKPHGKHYVRPRGHAYPPGTGPAGETCGSCQHCCRFQRGRNWMKCGKNHARWTGGRATDILAGDPACKFWEAEA
jgi:hypothetical protein